MFWFGLFIGIVIGVGGVALVAILNTDWSK